MLVWRSLDDIEADFGPSVVTVGNFDGVHLGHRYVLDQARQVAATQQAPVVAVTLDPHPMRILRPEQAPAALTTVDRRAELLLAAGADRVLVLPFTRELASWTPEEFVSRILVDALSAEAVVVGENFRFGAKAAGTTQVLAELGERYGFSTHALTLAGAEHPWSSSYIRQCLAEGDVAAAAVALGRPHAIVGEVVEGAHRGRELGFPTANVPTAGLSAVPADGVYAGWLRALPPAAVDDGKPMPAAISVGTNPTFDGIDRNVESYVLDRDDLELYGVTVEVSFGRRIRGQLRFDAVPELIDRMRVDVEEARTYLDQAQAPDGER
jgi:riboflavin kinase / FMN adenylyltransferase